MAEAKIDQAVPPTHIRIPKRVPILVYQGEGTADLGAPDAFGGFGDALTLHARFLVAEVEDKTGAGCEEESACFPGEGL